jgi:uncharacterized protein (TIGR04255 family)
MPDNPIRPKNLPDFRQPPLNEVLLGVQFAPAKGYDQIRAGEVWNLFRTDFPNVEEQPPLAPVFETFGLSPMAVPLNFGIATGAQHDRFWFLTPEKDELIQFQHDRLLHNWRKVGDQSNEYPRFEKMIVSFEKELRQLENYFNSLEPQPFVCNQAEISYINHIPIAEVGDERSSKWVRFLNFGDSEPDDVACYFRRVLKGPSGVPYARLAGEFSSAGSRGGGRIFSLTLTVRGAPRDTEISSAIEFLKMGREVIVNEFAAITTDSAQSLWERIQ